MYDALGIDCWIIVPVRSVSREGHSLEGTRLTITKNKDQPEGHEFSIRTPVTPFRWADFDQELSAAFEAICKAALGAGHRSCLSAVHGAHGRGFHFVFSGDETTKTQALMC
jgi:hypothetical protein